MEKRVGDYCEQQQPKSVMVQYKEYGELVKVQIYLPTALKAKPSSTTLSTTQTKEQFGHTSDRYKNKKKYTAFGLKKGMENQESLSVTVAEKQSHAG